MFHAAKFAPFLSFAVTLGVAAATCAHAQTPAPLTVKVYSADANSFHVSAVVVSGKTEAIVIDSCFTRADALRIAANVFDSGKILKTIFISNADPDFYFGAEVLKNIFPQAQVLTTPDVREKIQAKLASKVSFWAPKMGSNAPLKPIVPDELKGTTLSVDGEAIEIRGTTGELAHRPYAWIPSIKTVAGNLAVFGNLHASAVRYTREYLLRFDAELGKAKDIAELIESMKRAYPLAGLLIALDIGAKVNKGEMPW